MQIIARTPLHEALTLTLPVAGVAIPQEGETLALTWASDAGVIVDDDGPASGLSDKTAPRG